MCRFTSAEVDVSFQLGISVVIVETTFLMSQHQNWFSILALHSKNTALFYTENSIKIENVLFCSFIFRNSKHNCVLLCIVTLLDTTPIKLQNPWCVQLNSTCSKMNGVTAMDENGETVKSPIKRLGSTRKLMLFNSK